VPSQVSLFASKIFNKRILTKDNLIHHGVVLSPSISCLRCENQETIDHLFLVCDLTLLSRHCNLVVHMCSGRMIVFVIR